ncbi:hypothetical protein [Taklimakanibacter lacteus]|uniref:hypothetical protein n=1 Tax=Taklimakanibacter lacteus TaxID=2268456 RepID=UPI000E66F8C3
MILRRFALCFIALLSFSAVHSIPVNADLLTDIKKGARKAGNAIERGVKKTGRAIERGVKKTGQAIEYGYCDTFTDKSDRRCRIESGIGYDKKGTYTYDPKNPKKKYRGDKTDPVLTERDKELNKLAEFVKNKEVTAAEIEDRDVHHFRPFLQPNAKLGQGYPEKEKLVPPTKSGEMRPCCLVGGGGSFLNDRREKTKLRFYGGNDYLTRPGDPVYATIDGWVERRKDPRKGLQGVVLRSADGYRSAIYFVELVPEIDQALAAKSRFAVKAGETLLGKAQDLHPTYPADVPNHVLVVMSDPKGNLIDPSGKILVDRAPKTVPAADAPKPETAAKPEATAKSPDTTAKPPETTAKP